MSGIKENSTNEITFVQPMDIEKESFRIITEELENYDFDTISPENLPVVKRVIHTTADFSYGENLVFSKEASKIAISLMKSGVNIVTDTSMVMAGINKTITKNLGCNLHCFIGDETVALEAKERGVTRSMVAVEKAAMFSPLIYVVGNAPTALIALDHLIKQGKIRPDFIIAVPVGFVNVVESKELILSSKIPHIVAKGRKGGSNVAAAIVNALLYQIER